MSCALSYGTLRGDSFRTKISISTNILQFGLSTGHSTCQSVAHSTPDSAQITISGSLDQALRQAPHSQLSGLLPPSVRPPIGSELSKTNKSLKEKIQDLYTQDIKSK